MFVAAVEEIGVEEEVVVETTCPAKKRTQLLKKGLESACKNMLLLAVDPGLKAEAMPLTVYFEAFPSRKNLWKRTLHRHPSFHHASHKQVLDLLQTNTLGRHHN